MSRYSLYLSVGKPIPFLSIFVLLALLCVPVALFSISSFGVKLFPLAVCWNSGLCYQLCPAESLAFQCSLTTEAVAASFRQRPAACCLADSR